MSRRRLVLMLLLTGVTGCPETWGRDGTIERALHRDVLENYLEDSTCDLGREEWLDFCGTEDGRRPASCPEGCPTAKDDAR
jgi:hypothetical protein